MRQHLAALLIGVLYGDDEDSLRMARTETHRLVDAVTLCLGTHPLDESGGCTACRATGCVLRDDLRQALRPILTVPVAGG
ncbi:hypothetical protein ALI22I_04365 [Saccharothrix sp. ALI-22-I]|nr:hypothetical protein ALI22I_04365 [Saccharothrix sp. ALI-22-I]